MRWLAAVLASLILAVGLTVGILAAWSSVRDPDVSHDGPVPELRFPTPIQARPQPLPPLSRPAALDAAIREVGEGALRDALFQRPALGPRHPVRGRATGTTPRPALWAAAFGPALLAGPVAPAADGSFELPQVPAGQVEICLGPDPATLRSRWTWRRDVALTGPLDLGTIQADGERLEVRVVRGTPPRPVDGLMLRLRRPDARNWLPWFPQLDADGMPAGRTTADGAAVFPRLPPGGYQIEVLSADQEPLHARAFELRSAQTLTIELR